MNWRNTVIAAAVLLVLVVAALLLFREPPADEPAAKLPEIGKDSVTKIWIRGPVTQTPEDKQAGKPLEYEEVTLERQGEGEQSQWKLTTPVQYPAMKSYVDTLLTRLEELEIKDLATENSSSWKELEVDDEQAVHVKVWSGTSQLAELFVGTYKSGNTMVRMPGSERVWKVGGSIRYVFSKRVRDWRDKTILELDNENVRRISFSSPGGTFSFERPDKDWTQILEPGQAGIENFDGAKVKSLSGSAARLRAVDFEDGADQAKLGLNPPVATIELTVETPPEGPTAKDADEVKAEQDAGTNPMAAEPPKVEHFKLFIGSAKDDKNTYAQLEGNPQVFLITKNLAERLSPAPDKLATAPKPEGEEASAPDPAAALAPPPMAGDQGSGGIPPEVMKQVQAEIKKQQMLKKLTQQPAP